MVDATPRASGLRGLGFVALVALGTFAAAPPNPARAEDLPALVAGAGRSPANRARDPYRHPLEDLAFLSVQPTDTVIEILPGGAGYWTEILAPYLKDGGRYIAANGPRDSTSEETQADNAAFAAKTAADPANYARVEVAEFAADGSRPLGAPGSADVVLTFRNLHNWMKDGTADHALASFFSVLKPGGVLGMEDHRARADAPQDPRAPSGYVRQDYAIALAERAGFRLAGASEANANPKDTKDYPVGVWALPPTYRLKEQDRAKYAAIGESDRFLLKFVKPLEAK